MIHFSSIHFTLLDSIDKRTFVKPSSILKHICSGGMEFNYTVCVQRVVNCRLYFSSVKNHWILEMECIHSTSMRPQAHGALSFYFLPIRCTLHHTY